MNIADPTNLLSSKFSFLCTMSAHISPSRSELWLGEGWGDKKMKNPITGKLSPLVTLVMGLVDVLLFAQHE